MSEDVRNRHVKALGEERYHKLFRSFKALCTNKNLDHDEEGCFFVTEKSFRENFELVFGHTNELLRERLLDLIFGNTAEPVLTRREIPKVQARSQTVTFM